MNRPVYEVLEDIMLKKNLRVADIAKICDLPDSTVRGIITRKQNSVALEVAFRLSRGLGVSLEMLNGEVVDNEKQSVELDQREYQHIKKYQSLNETGKDQVDSYTDYILSNPANRRKETQEDGKKGERMCEVTSPQDGTGNEDIVRVAVYDSDGKIVGYDLVTREVYEKLEQLGFTVGQERELRIAQPTEIGRAHV